MVEVTWILSNGERSTIDVKEGMTLMQAAVDHNIDGIIGECGGGMMCATCHVYVEPPFDTRLESPGGMENDMLDMTEAPRQPQSRLSCQVVVSSDLNGITLKIPSKSE